MTDNTAELSLWKVEAGKEENGKRKPPFLADGETYFTAKLTLENKVYYFSLFKPRQPRTTKSGAKALINGKVHVKRDGEYVNLAWVNIFQNTDGKLFGFLQPTEDDTTILHNYLIAIGKNPQYSEGRPHLIGNLTVKD